MAKIPKSPSDSQGLDNDTRAETRSLASAVSLNEYTDDAGGEDAHRSGSSQDAPPTYQDIGPTVQHRRIRYYRDDQSIQPIQGLFPKTALPNKAAPRDMQTLHAPYSQDPKILHDLLSSQARIPPQPLVHVVGTHLEVSRDKDGKKQEKRVTDFDIKVDLSEIYAKRRPAYLEQQYREQHMGVANDQYYDDADYPIPEGAVSYWHTLRSKQPEERAFRGGIRKGYSSTLAHNNYRPTHRSGSSEISRAPGYTDAEPGASSLNTASPQRDEETALTDPPDYTNSPEYWCEQFCMVSVHRRPCLFRFTRQITGWNTALVKQRLEALIRATNYRGDISISFPIHNASLTILSPHKINILRSNPYVFWACIILQLWIITWPMIYLLTRTFDVVYVDWPYSKTSSDTAEFVTEYASVSEEQWLNSWGRTVAEKAVAKHSGFITWSDVSASIRAREAMGHLTTGEHGNHEDYSREGAHGTSRVRVDLGNGYANAAYGAVNALAGLGRQASGEREGARGGSGRAWGASDASSNVSGSVKVGGASVRF